jgi:hypothetical protein
MSRVLGEFLGSLPVGSADDNGLSAPFENYFHPASELGTACGRCGAIRFRR